MADSDRSAADGAAAPLAAMEALVRQLPLAAVLAHAPDGAVVASNAPAALLWRRSAGQGVGDVEAWRGFHPDGRRYAAGEWPVARALATGAIVEREEIEIERDDGTRGVVLADAAPVRDPSGAIVAAVSTFVDVTEQRRQEGVRRFLMEAGSLLSSSLDYATTLRTLARLAVPHIADWCGVDVVAEGGRIERLAVEHVDPARAELARELARRFPPDPDAPNGVAEVLRTGQAALFPVVSEAMLRFVARDDEHRRLLRELGLHSAMLVPLVARGRTLGALTLALAGPERRYGPADLQLAEELAGRAALAIDNARLYRDAQAADRAKTDFLAVMSHELRTPLTAIIGYSELLELGIPEPVTERQQEQVARIESAARHLLTLIEEILTVSTLETGRPRVRPRTIPVNELLHRAADVVRPMAADKELALEVVETESTLLLETDEDKALQVLLSLLSNAVKFTERGSIRLGARRSGEQVELEVADTGIGVEAQHRDRIFDPFWQVEQPITRKSGGTGLGLTIARRLADLLGGEIVMRSEPGRGSTFTVRLPLWSGGKEREV